jgi:hypothetical protein
MKYVKKLYSLCLQGSYKQWCAIYAAILFLPVLVFLPFNILIDYSAIFSVNPIAKEGLEKILNGKTIANLNIESARPMNRYFIKNGKNKIDIIAVGSSRTQGIRREYLTSDATFFNHAMGRATIADYIGIVGGYKKFKGYIPKKVILGVDPWVFNENNTIFTGDWELIEDLYFYLIKEMGAEDADIHKEWHGASVFQRLISLEYFGANIRYLYNIFFSGEKYNYVVEGTEIPASSCMTCDMREVYAVYAMKRKMSKAYPAFEMESILSVDITILPCTTCETRKVYSAGAIEPDGSVHFPIKYLFRGKEAWNQINHVGINARGLEYYKKLSNTRLFEKFVDYLQEENVEVIFFLPPYHPVTYNKLLPPNTPNNRYEIILDVEEYLKKIAKEKEIQLIGSYNPEVYSLTHKNFVDGFHTTSHATGKIFKSHPRLMSELAK